LPHPIHPFRVRLVDTSIKENETVDVTFVNPLSPIGGKNKSGPKGRCRWGCRIHRAHNDIIESFVFGVGVGTETGVRLSEG